MGEIFTFVGLISHDHNFLFVSHILLVALIVLGLAKMATSKMQLVPSGVQNVMEAYLVGVISMGRDVIGEELSRKYLPLVATIGLVVFVANMIGIVPGFEAPSSSLNMTLALALMVFVYYNFEGIRVNGVVHYFAHFMGPVKLLAPLMFPIEIVSHFSRIISLSFRLFGNIKGEDIFLAVVLMLAPWVAPLPAYALLTFSALLQTFIFMILTYVYLAGAVLISEEH
ncbi:MAG: F0F1 ATP synthase subunit A [Epsilonproteobacteria bacterium]|jgi:F-type H+-transporting ATPase subunit a|uniref:ATP synthase subunit a n=1 Tax=Sulfurospirillum cavolei TaxID=366522 RepID=A0A2D3WH77_9BACT|nr:MULTISPECIES: F0F1 ATP synthase subunit A [Sulfurospirillum]NCB53678.1 F0F1 ATP synthase subunit A [Campylobacterota bacterium]KHG33600.1 MAG: ATP synthase F0F1 subunit A [Sulfurospirillum sp. MES]MCD8544647.1 F0F1 ATP synthase subunit A [Sulfurospirillum cavolei]MCP3651316.1 F0F1 ATP synthase subunit A [Sulfurospirillum sp. DNRA8]MCR1810163.1 F0F1 ATP synthase subunit A [Sulfurospirillum sp. DNRA8]